MTKSRGPLPQWDTLTGGVYEAAGDGDQRWRLWATAGDYRLAPVDDLADMQTITADHGLYYAMSIAGMRIAPDAVRADPDGARRELGLS